MLAFSPQVHTVINYRCTMAGGNILDSLGRYRYMEDLLELDRPRPATQPGIPEGVGVVR